VKLNLRPDKNDTITIGHPTLDNDETMLVFASNMKWPGHKGGKDLYMVKLDKDGMPTGAPTNLGRDQYPKDEMFPFIRHDGVLYFSSTGRPAWVEWTSSTPRSRAKALDGRG
jgi:peptidoglycan-associated lipoprotein